MPSPAPVITARNSDRLEAAERCSSLSHTATVSCTTQSRTLKTTKPRFSSPALVLPYRTPEVKGFSVYFECEGLCVSFSEGSVYLENTL